MSTRSGELAMRPLPAVLLDLHEDLATGKLSLRRGRIAKSIDLVNGNPVSTTSTPRDETLGHYLVGSGVIDEDQHRLAVGRAASAGGKLGEALVTLRMLTVEQLIDQLGKQARHKLVQALRWPQGAWRFDETSEAIEGMQLRMVEVVLGGLRETAVENIDRLTRLDNLAFELTDRGHNLRSEIKRTFGERAVAALASGASMAEIERAFGDRAQARIAVDALIMCAAVATKVEAVGLGTGAPVTLPGIQVPAIGRSPTRPVAGSALFEILFEDLGSEPDGAAPLEFAGDDSGVVSLSSVAAATAEHDHSGALRQRITAEHARLKGADHYAVLMIGRKAAPSDIDGAFEIRAALLERDGGPLIEARDVSRVDEIRAAYLAARTILLDDRKRAAYDRELAGGELVDAPPAIDTELNFRVAEELMTRRQWDQAIGHIKTVIARAPNEADYHAALGWSEWMAGAQQPDAADAARPHLNHALEINPDHAAAHDYKGRIGAQLHSDDSEALFHLERAIDLDASRIEAVSTIESLLISRGELRRWERILKRLLFQLRGKGNLAEVKAWVRLARLYFDQLDDQAAGAAAAANAKRIAPDDPDVVGVMARAGAHRRSTLEPIRAGWHDALGDPSSGAALVRNAEASGHADAAFLAASTMVALGSADSTMAALYEAKRVRTVLLPSTNLDRDHWALLRHRDDTVELGALMELVAPAIHALAPMTLAESDLDPSLRLDADLPAPFARLRARYAELLGVTAAPVYARVELGSQIHVVAADPPVLVAGDEALRAPERPELVFRLARAMTFLWPGRAVGASRPGRVLRAIVLAIFREASGSPVGIDEPLAERAAAAIAELPDATRTQARAAALRLLSRGSGLNLTVWARSLTRTADRAGMLLSGDVPAAFAGAREVGELERDLVEFAYSAAHVNLRQMLGLTSRA